MWRPILALMAGLASLLCAGRIDAAPPPPPPPPTPVCGWCKGPPPPPTPVPVLQPTAVAAAPTVQVTLTPDQVKRGATTKIEVKAEQNTPVTIQVLYRKHKPSVYRGKVGADGQYSKSWRVPKWAPRGKTTVLVKVGQNSEPMKVTLVIR